MAYTETWNEQAIYRSSALLNASVTNTLIPRTIVSSRSGQAVPNYREIIRRRGDATSPYTLDATRLLVQESVDTYSSGRHRTTDSALVRSSFFGTLAAPNIVAHLDIDQSPVQNAALAKAYKRLGQAKTQFQGLTFLGEFKDTVRAFKRPFPAILEFTEKHLRRHKKLNSAIRARNVSKGNWSESSARKAAADSILEYNFGVAPLINDAQAAAEALARYVEFPNSERTRFTARASGEVRRVLSNSSVPTGCWNALTTSTVHETTYGVQYICVLDDSMRFLSDASRLRNLFGIHPGEAVSAAYELIPWSWLVDYFSNFGDVLNAVTVCQQNVRYVVKTTRLQTVVTYTHVPDLALTKARFDSQGYTRDFSHYGKSGRVVLQRTTLSRSKELRLQVPTLQMENPLGSPSKVLNMLAVLSQQGGRSSPSTYG